MLLMSSAGTPSKCGDVDARAIVPVRDAIGGVVIYAGGQPAYYVLHGEWFEALPAPRPAARDGASGPRGGDVDPAAVLHVS